MKLHLLKYSATLSIALIAGAGVVPPASAAAHPAGPPAGAWHDSGHAWWGWGLGLGLGLGLEAEYLANPYLFYSYPGYYYPYPGYDFPYTPPALIVEQQPPAASQPPATAPQPPATWFYCDSAKAYFPYVATCPEPWRTVPAAPPSGMPR